MFWLNACPRCKRGAVYLDIDNARHCVRCGFVQYLPLAPYFVAEAAASRDGADIGAPITATSAAGS